jgi:hypothetical protein
MRKFADSLSRSFLTLALALVENTTSIPVLIFPTLLTILLATVRGGLELRRPITMAAKSVSAERRAEGLAQVSQCCARAAEALSDARAAARAAGDNELADILGVNISEALELKYQARNRRLEIEGGRA